MEIQPYTIYEATVKLRRGEGWPLNPAFPKIDTMDGQRVRVVFGWTIDEDGHSLYLGEAAMTPVNAELIQWGERGWPCWLASGDLTDLAEVGPQYPQATA